MFLFLLMSNILFIPLINGKNATVLSLNKVVTNKTLEDHELGETVLSKPDLTLVSEGGSLLPKAPLTLPNEKMTSLIDLDGEFEINKEKPVAARKGVGNDTGENDILSTKTNAMDNIIAQNGNSPNNSPVIKTVENNTLSDIKQDTAAVNKTKPIHKPLFVDYDALVKNSGGIENDESKLPKDTLEQNTQPENIRKVYPDKANSHPGMIMPIVITILVVPVFALVSYRAFKLGQEAWKNRHYKRMDFLLDGMYND